MAEENTEGQEGQEGQEGKTLEGQEGKTLEGQEGKTPDTSSDGEEGKEGGGKAAKPEDTDGKPEDGEGKSADEGKEGASPYEPFTIPEGMELDQKMNDAFIPVAQELGLTQKQAQRLVDFYAESIAQTVDANQDAWSDMRKEWRDKAVSDSEFGGDEFDANLAIAMKAVADPVVAEDGTVSGGYGSEALREALAFTGVGDHPEFIRFAYRVGKTLTSDDVEPGKPGGGRPDERTQADRIYGQNKST